MSLRIAEEAVRTDTGRQRNANEDSLFTRRAAVRRRRRDGRRPGRRGRLESGGRVLRRRAAARRRRSGCCEETIEGANRTIHELARKDPSLAGMGTTITAAIVDLEAEEVAIGHVGDSRAYRLRGGRLRAADPRPLAGRGDAAQRPAHRRPGRGPPAALDHHPRARPRTRGRGRRADRPRPGRRRLPDLLRRADDDARRRADRPHPRPRHLAATRRCGRWSTKPTGPAAATTSPSSPSGSRTPPRPPPATRGRGPTRARP